MTERKIKRPTKIRVLTIMYEVLWLTEDEWYQARYPNEATGITERDKGLITMRYDSTSSEDALRAVLLHEVFHACTQVSRTDSFLSDVSDGEEFFIAQVSPVLMAVLNDNPNFVAYLLNLGQPS